MDSLVLDSIAKCVSGNPDSLALKTAEDSLKRLAAEPEYPRALLHIALAAHLPHSQRQLAALSLKAFIDTHWSSKSDRFEGPEPDETMKLWIKTNIIQSLAEPVTSIRVALLFQQLMDNLKSGHPDRVHGAMRVLAEFVRDDITDQQFPAVAPILLPELYAIFSNSAAFKPRIRAKAVIILRDFIDMIFMVKQEHPEVITNYLDPLLLVWIDGFKAVLSEEYSAENAPVKSEVISTIVKVTRGFPKQAGPHILPLMNLVWSDLLRFSDQYEREYILPHTNDFHGHSNDEIDSDGETLGLQAILLSLVEFAQLAIRKKSIQSVFLAPPTSPGQQPLLWQFVHLCLRYLRVTTEMEIAWESDMNQFIQDEEEDTLSFNMRVAIKEILIVLIDSYGIEALRALCACATDLFQQSQTQKSANVRSWWKGTEAALLAIGRVEAELIDAINGGAVQFDISSLFNTIVLDSFKSFEYPLLQGRALWFASQFAEILPKDLTTQYIQGAAAAIRRTSVNAAVRICALKAIRQFCDIVPKTELVSVQADVIEGILSLAPSATADTLSLLLEALIFVVKIDQAVTDRYEPAISSLIDLIASMATSLNPAFQERMFPNFVASLDPMALEQSPELVAVRSWSQPALYLKATESNANLQYSGPKTSMTLMATMIRKAPEPISPLYVQQLFPKVIQIVMTAKQSAIMQNGQEVIEMLVRRDFTSILNWTDGQTTGLSHIMQFISKLLTPSVSESSASFIGSLITRLIRKNPPELIPMIPSLLLSIIQRLESARMPTFVQTLVLVFAHLIQKQADACVEFLCKTGVKDRPAMNVLLNAWCDNFQDFHGAYAGKVSCTAMAKLFAFPDANLDGVLVRGDLIVSNDSDNYMVTTDDDTTDEDDADIQADPVFHLDLKEFIEDFVQTIAKSNLTALQQLSGFLKHDEQMRLQSILQSSASA
eukprot:jgi/Hompol1/4950/HPOL_004050-RA